MTEQAAMSTAARAWPMTPDAARALADEIGNVRQVAAALAGESLEEGITNLAFAQAARRLETLTATQRRAEVLEDPGRAAIGRRVTIRHDGGDVATYTLVCPGEGDPSRGLISADSPLGSALLGARPGSSVQVAAPGGTWTGIVVAVD